MLPALHILLYTYSYVAILRITHADECMHACSNGEITIKVEAVREGWQNLEGAAYKMANCMLM